jgi:hypothetical protein
MRQDFDFFRKYTVFFGVRWMNDYFTQKFETGFKALQI